VLCGEPLPRTPGIYRIVLLSEAGLVRRVYTGSAVNLYKRRYNHQGDLRKNIHACKKLQNAYNKYGERLFRFEVLEHVVNKIDLIPREQSWIDYYLTEQGRDFLLNTCLIAGSCLGRKTSDETRKRLSTSHIGYQMPVEQRNKISEALTGRPQSAEKGRKISKTLTGRKRPDISATRKRLGLGLSEEALQKAQSPEARASRSAKLRGRRATNETRAKMSAGITPDVKLQRTKTRLISRLRENPDTCISHRVRFRPNRQEHYVVEIVFKENGSSKRKQGWFQTIETARKVRNEWLELYWSQTDPTFWSQELQPLLTLPSSHASSR
jgi:group I intron endonuclease